MQKKELAIVETKHYIAELLSVMHKGQDKDELRNGIKQALCENPLIGNVIPRTGGVRKFRYATPGKGKRGGYRIIYYFYDEMHPVFLLTIYSKSKIENLTPKEEKLYFEAAKLFKSNFKKVG